MSSLAKEHYRSELRKIDWDFTGEEGNAGFAAYHWYPARFVPQLASILINYFSEPGAVVLDPFCGSGTTLVEAYRYGRLAIGIDVSPIAVLITQAKLVAFDEKGFAQYVDKVMQTASAAFGGMLMAQSSALFSNGNVTNARNSELKNLIPNYAENGSWYHHDTLRQLSSIWLAINEYHNSKYTVVGQAAFSAILRASCSQEKHWGWICDNVKPKGRELVYKNALTKYSEKLREFRASATELRRDAAELQETIVHSSQLKVLSGDCVEVIDRFESRSIDLVVTSPPYFSMTDYISSQRLSNLWFNAESRQQRSKEIGARYRRQNVTALDEYLTSLENSFVAIARVLKKGAFCCIVIGESPRHQPFLTKFQDMFERIGFEKCDSLSRRVAKKRSLSPSLQQEKILILRKT